MATWTFTLRSGVGPLADVSVVLRGARYDVDAQLAAGGGSIVTTDDELASLLKALRVSSGAVFDVNGVADPQAPARGDLVPVHARQSDFRDGATLVWDGSEWVAGGSGSVRTLLMTGNSYGEGYTSTGDRRMRFGIVAATKLGAEEFNYSKDGSVLHRASDSAGWRASLHRIKPIRMGNPLSPTVRKPTHAGDWIGPAGGEVAVLSRNANDMLTLGPDPAKVRIFIEALRAEATRMRCCALYDVDDPGMVYGGAATTIATDTGTTDGRWKPTLNGTYVERVLPAHFPGGWVHFGTVAGFGLIGGTYRIAVDGVTVQEGDTGDLATDSALATHVVACVHRFYVPPGQHTIRFTALVSRVAQGSGGFGASVNYIGVEANDPGLVVLMAAPRFTAAAQAGQLSPYGAFASNATSAVYLAAQKALCSEFTDGLVQLFDMDESVQLQPSLFDDVDLYHLSEKGNLVVGSDLADFISARLPAVRRGSHTRWLLVSDALGFYSGASFASGAAAQGFGVYPLPSFRRDAHGVVSLRGFITRSAALGVGVPGPLFTLPQAFRPDAACTFGCPAADNAGVRATHAVIVDQTGLVQLLPPSNAIAALNGGNSFIDLSTISFKAAQ